VNKKMETINTLQTRRLQGTMGLKSLCMIQIDKNILQKYDHIAISEIKKDENSEEKLIYLVSYYFFKSRYRKVLSYIQKLILINPKNAEYHFNEGTVYAKIHKYDKAINSLMKSIELGFSYFSVYYNIALIYTIQKKYDEAIMAYSEAIKLKNDDVLSYYNRGELYCKKNEIELAISDLKRVIDIDEDAVTALADFGELNYCIGNYKEAVESTKQAALKNKTYESAFKSMLFRTSKKMQELYVEGFNFYKNNDLINARKKLKNVLEIYPNHDEAKIILNEIDNIVSNTDYRQSTLQREE